MATTTTTPEYEGPERRRWPRRPERRPLGRNAWAVIFTAAWLAVMIPLGVVVYFAVRSDDRAERAGRTACQLSATIEHLADTLDAGLNVLVGEDRAVAEADLRRTITEGREQADRARSECRPGGGRGA